MSLKQELQTWSDALDAFDKQDFDRAIVLFQEIADTSKIHFNLGLIHATIGSHSSAVTCFEEAISLDQYLAIGYFQQGVSLFLLGKWAEAKRGFDEAFVYLRGNRTIVYEQLGLQFKLYSCEVLFNRGLAAIYLGLFDEGMEDLRAASAEKQTASHSVIDDAILDSGEGYTVFSIPVGVLFRPSANKLRNLPSRDYLGTAKLIATTSLTDTFTDFDGPRTLAGRGRSESAPAEPLAGKLERSATARARLEKSGDGIAKPLRRRPTVEEVARGVKTMGLGRSQTVGAVLNVGAAETRDSDQLKSSGQQTRQFNRPSTYGVSTLLDSYYTVPSPSAAGPSSAATQPPTAGLPYLSSSPESYTPKPSLPRITIPSRAGPRSQPPSSSSAGGERSSPAPSRKSSVGGSELGPSGSDGTQEKEMSKVRVKLRYKGDTRGMSIAPTLALSDFTRRIKTKFGSTSDLSLKYKDSDATLVSIVDDDDWESAMDQAREAAQGRPEGKLEIVVGDS